MKPTDLSNIMCMAWRFYRTTRQAFSECLKLAWRNFCLVRKMHTEVVRFYFRKVDGTLREAWGTLRSDIVPPIDGSDTRKKNDTVQVYFDTERQEWRCFKRLNLVF
jgi:hypothetical protein|nr:MAG TPA: hypothetical protein [Caudoviricetes sp.]